MQEEKYQNFIRLKGSFPFAWHERYVFVDTRDHLADQVFVQHKVAVDFSDGEFAKKGEKYIFVHCRIRKSGRAGFLASMEGLKKKMLLLGNADYPGFCRKWFTLIREEVGHGCENA